MTLPLSFRQVNLGANTSSETGNPWYVGDYKQLTISVATGSAQASRVTIVGSNDDGFSSTLSSANRLVNTNQWSIVTTIVVPGLYTIDPGFRWVNAIRDTAFSGQTASNLTVIFAGTT
jgi:hypothetical protein